MMYDKDFLLKLDNHREKEIYARIINLDFDENPIEQIEGQVIGGSINIDGTSAVRRTFSINLVAQDININDYLWGLKTKCKVEIGVKNIIDKKYPDIIWFKQGVYVITAFNVSHTVNNYQISISGKDKMCLLNGELGGSLPASIDFGVEEYYDKESNKTYYNHIPIKTILKESLHTYANEPYHNIILNDLDETAVELLDYKGDSDHPLYIFLNEAGIEEDSNFTLNGDTEVTVNGSPIKIKDIKNYNNRLIISSEITDEEDKPTKVEANGKEYTIAKITYGQTAGYRITELTYPGELISNIGESLTSIYDKIVSMLGGYEYFYDLDGRFVFQKKNIYTITSWNSLITDSNGTYADSAALASANSYEFKGHNLITSFQNSPNLQNLKNDYSIWGVRETVSGAEIPIHYRYAIDNKPNEYTQFPVSKDDVENYQIKHPEIKMTLRASTDEERKKWNSELNPPGTKEKDIIKIEVCNSFTSTDYDWREIIYQMAADYYAYNQLDDFLVKVAAANPQYPTGKTGYEQYYIDLQGFWRQLYNPFEINNPEYEKVELDDKETNEDNLYILGKYTKIQIPEKDSKEEIPNEKKIPDDEREREKLFAIVKVNGSNELHPLLDAIQINYKDSFIKPNSSTTFYIIGTTGEPVPIPYSVQDLISKNEIYTIDEEDDNKTPKKLIMCNSYLRDMYIYKYENDNEYHSVKTIFDSDEELKKVFYDDNKYKKQISQSPLTIEGKYDETKEDLKTYSHIEYFNIIYKYFNNNDKENNEKFLYWSKDIKTNPEGLNFWFDFLEASGSELGKYSISSIGDRAKVTNDKNVKSIYYRTVPNIIFITAEQAKTVDFSNKTGYGVVNIQQSLEGLFNISSQGKSAQDKLDELLYNHSYCIENITIQSIPVYYLEPNTRIFVQDDNSKINGSYTISRISLPLTYNGTMSITATKIPERLL